MTVENREKWEIASAKFWIGVELGFFGKHQGGPYDWRGMTERKGNSKWGGWYLCNTMFINSAIIYQEGI